MKSHNLRHRQARSQNKGLSRAGWLWTSPPPTRDRQGRAARARKGQLRPREASSTNLQAGSLLTKTSWDSGQSTSARRVAARDQLPRGDTHGTPENARPLYTQKTERLGRRRQEDAASNLGRPCSPSTWSPERLRPGKGTKRRPHRVCAFVEYRRT